MARRKEIWITQYAYFVVAYTLASMILSRDRYTYSDKPLMFDLFLPVYSKS